MIFTAKTRHKYKTKSPDQRRSARRGRAFIISLVLVLMPGPKDLTPVHAKIVGRDDRVPLGHARRSLYDGVGQVLCIDQGTVVSTTMTVVGNRRTIVGAGHYRQRASDMSLIPSNACRFRLVSKDGGETFTSSFEELAAERSNQRAVAEADWAVLRLSADVPRGVRPLELSVLASEDVEAQSAAFSIGFHGAGEKKGGKLLSPACRPRKVANHPFVFIHSCDALPGSSGALLFSASNPRTGIGIINGFSRLLGENYGHTIPAAMIAEVDRVS